MAEEGNEDSWLYGGSKGDEGEEEKGAMEEGEAGKVRDEFDDKRDDGRLQQEDSNTCEESQVENGTNEDQANMEEVPEDAAEHMEEQENIPNVKEKGENGSDSDESDDDDINVVIGDIKSGLSYNIKQRGNLLASNAAAVNEKLKQSTGKFNMEDFESVGTISGVAATEFSIDSLEEKPWRMPGADITDYFNYGFNEDTWRAYCERQKKMRLNESGVGLQGLAIGPVPGITTGHARTLTPLSNDNSKYTSIPGNLRRAGPPPGRKMTGSIDVIGSNGISSRREDGLMGKPSAKENAIQVMTADRREYSRAGGKFDAPIAGNFSGDPPPVDPFYEQETYNYGYEPTQDSQWNNNAWQPSGIKELTPSAPQMVPPPLGLPMPIQPIGHGPPPMLSQLRFDDADRERERDRDRERERDRDRRERDRRFERRRSRSRDRERDRGDRLLTEREIKQEPVDRDDESPSRDKDRRSKYRERSSRRERSRSRERSERSRRSRSRTRDRRSRSDKKKSHKRDKDDSE